MLCIAKRGDFRRRAALTMWVVGMKYVDIGRNLGVSGQRAKGLVFGGKYRIFRIVVDGLVQTV